MRNSKFYFCWYLSHVFLLRYQSFRRTLRGRSSRHSRLPLPMVDNRENQTTGESSASGRAETGAASLRPSHLPATSASSSLVASTSSTPSASSTPSTSTAPSTFHPLPPSSTPSTSSEPPSSSGPSTSSASSSRSANHLQSPAVKFLTRHDLIEFFLSKGVWICLTLNKHFSRVWFLSWKIFICSTLFWWNDFTPSLYHAFTGSLPVRNKK